MERRIFQPLARVTLLELLLFSSVSAQFLGAHCAGIERSLGLKLSQFNMAGETIELSQLPIPHLENLRSQLEEASIAPTEGT